MIRYSCESCQRKLLIKPELAGQQSKCPCGVAFTVPRMASAAAPQIAEKPVAEEQASNKAVAAKPPASKPPAIQQTTATPATKPTKQATATITVPCSKCDRMLRAPATAAGKAVRCTCGSLVLVPEKEGETRRGSTVVSVVNDKGSGAWLSELPPPPEYQAARPESGAEFWYVDAEIEDNQQPAQLTVPDAREASHEYIRNAEKEIRENRNRTRGTASGSLAMAQITLILVGLLNVVLYSVMYVNAPNEVQQVMKSGDVAMSEETLLQWARVIYGAYIAAGTIMFLLGALIYQFPVFCPLAGLLLYIVAIGVGAVLDPFSLVKGIIIKVLVILALIKAVNDGAYYND